MTKVSTVTQRWLSTNNLHPTDLISSMKDGRKWLSGRNLFEWDRSILVGFTKLGSCLSMQMTTKAFSYIELGEVESYFVIRDHHIPHTLMSVYQNNEKSIDGLVDVSGNFRIFQSLVVTDIKNVGKDVKIYISNAWNRFQTPLSKGQLIRTNGIRQLI